MRDYQIQGLNWMISLYHNGINGILADEMVRFCSSMSAVWPRLIIHFLLYRALAKLYKLSHSSATSSFTAIFQALILSSYLNRPLTTGKESLHTGFLASRLSSFEGRSKRGLDFAKKSS